MAAPATSHLVALFGFFLVLYVPLTLCSPEIVKIPAKAHFKPPNTNYTVEFESFYRSLKAKPCPPPPPSPKKRKPPPPSPPPPKKRNPPPPSPPPPKKRNPPPSQTSSEADLWLKPHNDARAALGIGPLAWDDQIAATALSWANNLASRGCIMEHGGHDGMGQNLAWWSGGDATGADAVGLWVDEKQYYSYGVFPDYCQSGEVCGHYTQVIWKDTTKVGCARVRCSNGGLEFVCNYYPPGNYLGEYPY